MPKPTKGPRLGAGPAHEKLLLGTLAEQLFEHGKITTTEAKAKRLRPLAEKLITAAKVGDLAARRRVLATIANKGVVHTLFTEIAPHFAQRDGGYTRITKVGPRQGDNAPMAVIELLAEGTPAKKAAVKQAENVAKKAAPAPVAPVAEVAEVAPEVEVVAAAPEVEVAAETAAE